MASWFLLFRVTVLQLPSIGTSEPRIRGVYSIRGHGMRCPVDRHRMLSSVGRLRNLRPVYPALAIIDLDRPFATSARHPRSSRSLRRCVISCSVGTAGTTSPIDCTEVAACTSTTHHTGITGITNSSRNSGLTGHLRSSCVMGAMSVTAGNITATSN